MTTGQPTIADVRALESFLVSSGESALLLTFQGILRSHEEYRAKALASSTPPTDDVRDRIQPRTQSEREAWDDGFATATASPPADDVREALADAITGIAVGGGYYGTTLDSRAAREAADLILAAFEVRPRGTVTDAEVNEAMRSYYQRDTWAGGWTTDMEARMRAALEAARAVRS